MIHKDSIVAGSTILDLIQLRDSGAAKVQDIVSYYHDRSMRYGKSLGAFIEVFDDLVPSLAVANASGILYGIPGGIKDNICQKNYITSCASRILSNYRAPYDATVIKRLRDAGALAMGRTNMDEFAMGSSTQTSWYGYAHNPWDETRTPGGSSGGSAACVAAGLVPWALGSETGGSVRQPASFCNLVGLKPTYGLLSRYGLIAYASSLDQIGLFTHTAYDAALLLSQIAGKDAHDMTTLSDPIPDYVSQLRHAPERLKIGIVRQALEADGIMPEVRRLLDDAMAMLEKMGHTLVTVDIPLMNASAAIYFIISRAQAASNLARFDGIRYGVREAVSGGLTELYEKSRGHGFGEEIIRRIIIGNYALSAGHAHEYYDKALQLQTLLQDQYQSALQQADVLFMPTTPCPAFKLGEFDASPLLMDLQDYFTALANLTGMPALSIPGGFTAGGLPVGFQLLGAKLQEGLLLSLAHAYQQRTDWHKHMPAKYA